MAQSGSQLFLSQLKGPNGHGSWVSVMHETRWNCTPYYVKIGENLRFDPVPPLYGVRGILHPGSYEACKLA